MRLEAVIVGRVADGAMVPGKPIELRQILGCVAEQRLFHQQVLAVLQQVAQNPQFDAVGSAHQRRIVIINRHLLDAFIPGIGMNRIHRGDRLVPGYGKTLLALDSQTNDDDPQMVAAPTNNSGTGIDTRSRRLSTSSGPMGLLPSRSQAMAAAIEPRMDAATGSFETASARVE